MSTYGYVNGNPLSFSDVYGVQADKDSRAVRNDFEPPPPGPSPSAGGGVPPKPDATGGQAESGQEPGVPRPPDLPPRPNIPVGVGEVVRDALRGISVATPWTPMFSLDSAEPVDIHERARARPCSSAADDDRSGSAFADSLTG